MMYTGFILALLFSVHGIDSARILLIPPYHYSHVNLLGSAGAALSASGHDVTLMVSSMFSSVPTKLKLKSLQYDLSKDARFQEQLDWVLFNHEKDITFIMRVINEFFPVFGKACEQILGNQQLMEQIAREKFDLVIIDNIPVNHCLYTIPYKLNISYISINVFLDPWSAGIPASAAFEPIAALPCTNRMSFFQRFMIAMVYTVCYNLPPLTISSEYFVQKYAPEKPLVTTHFLYRNSALFLVNHEILCMDFPRVSAPNYQFIGGSSAKPPQPLPTDVADFVNDAPHGVVIISFGSLSVLQKMWLTLKPLVIHAFKELPQKAVILYSLDDNIQDFPPNVKVLNWLPQNDLLGHPNSKLFITHGGNNGQLEAVYHGVPSLVVPMAGDQVYNGIKVETHQYGKMIKDWNQITSGQFLVAIREVLTNATYSENIKKCSRIIKSQPSTHDRIVFWVNHILEFGGAHLRPPSLDLPLYQVLMVDLILFATFLVIVMISIGLFCSYCFIKKCCLNRGKSKQKTA